MCGSASPGWKQLELAKVQLMYNHCSPSVFVQVFLFVCFFRDLAHTYGLWNWKGDVKSLPYFIQVTLREFMQLLIFVDQMFSKNYMMKQYLVVPCFH